MPKFKALAGPLDDYFKQVDIASPARIQAALADLDADLAKQGTTFLCGNSISIADFQLFAEFYDCKLLNISFDSFPNCAAWYKACREYPGIKDSHDLFDTQIPTVQAMLKVEK
jgi:glutathione S-transferase